MNEDDFKVQSNIQDVINANASNSSYALGPIPVHEHNGTDSPRVSLYNIDQTFPMTAITPTKNPNRLGTSIYLDSTTGRIWYWDSTNNVFKSTSVATVTNLFGDGSDGDVTISINTTLTRDMYYHNLTINNGVTLNPGGYMIFVSGTLTRVGTGVIALNGNNGTAGGPGANGVFNATAAGGTAGAAGAAVGAGTLPIAPAGKIGATGGDANPSGSSNGNNGTNGATSTNGLGSDGSAGGTGGAGGNAGFVGASPGTAGTAGSANFTSITPRDVFPLRSLFNSILGSWTRYGANGGSGSGSGGGAGCRGGDAVTTGGGGGGSGGSGASGGFILVFAKTIVAANTNTLFQATGGNGGNGGNGGTGGTNPGFNGAGGGGGGGGAGGPGGVVVLVYNSSDQAVASLISVAAGTGGTKGTGGATGGGGANPGVDGNNGTTGNTGTSYTLAI